MVAAPRLEAITGFGDNCQLKIETRQTIENPPVQDERKSKDQARRQCKAEEEQRRVDESEDPEHYAEKAEESDTGVKL